MKKIIVFLVILLAAGELWIRGYGFRWLKNNQWLYGQLTDTTFQISEKDCDRTLWNRVYSPERLYIINPCVQITGTVSGIFANPDGDYHINVKPDREYTASVNLFNQIAWGGSLVTEIVCAHATEEDICQGYNNNAYIPKKGDRVTVKGSLVIDTAYGWREIHPASFIRI